METVEGHGWLFLGLRDYGCEWEAFVVYGQELQFGARVLVDRDGYYHITSPYPSAPDVNVTDVISCVLSLAHVRVIYSSNSQVPNALSCF